MTDLKTTQATVAQIQKKHAAAQQQAEAAIAAAQVEAQAAAKAEAEAEAIARELEAAQAELKRLEDEQSFDQATHELRELADGLNQAAIAYSNALEQFVSYAKSAKRPFGDAGHLQSLPSLRWVCHEVGKPNFELIELSQNVPTWIKAKYPTAFENAPKLG